MIFVIIVLCIALIIGGIAITTYSCSLEDLGMVLAIPGSLALIVSIVAAIILTVNVSGLSVIDAEIAMYEEENIRIETQITEVVKGYQEYESDIFSNAASDSPMLLVTLYPELKSDALVQSQIELYNNNHSKIVSLRAKDIKGDVLRWWLYFGG